MNETTRTALEGVEAVLAKEFAALETAWRLACDANTDDFTTDMYADFPAMVNAGCALQDAILDLAGPARAEEARAIVRCLEDADILAIEAAYLLGRKDGARLTAQMLLGRDAV